MTDCTVMDAIVWANQHGARVLAVSGGEPCQFSDSEVQPRRWGPCLSETAPERTFRQTTVSTTRQAWLSN